MRNIALCVFSPQLCVDFVIFAVRVRLLFFQLNLLLHHGKLPFLILEFFIPRVFSRSRSVSRGLPLNCCLPLLIPSFRLRLRLLLGFLRRFSLRLILVLCGTHGGKPTIQLGLALLSITNPSESSKNQSGRKNFHDLSNFRIRLID